MDDRELVVADTDLVDWQQAITPALPNDQGDIEDFGRAGEQPHGGSAGVPVTALDYIIPEVEGYEWTLDDERILEPFVERFHQLGMTQQQVEGCLEFYAEMAANGQLERDGSADGEVPAGRYKVAKGNWGKEDAAPLGEFLRDMAAAGAPQSAVTAATRWYLNFTAQNAANLKALDKATGNEAKEALAPYLDVERDGLLVRRWLEGDDMPADLCQKLMNARLQPSGRKLAHDPDFFVLLRWMALQADAPTDRKTQLENLLKEDPQRYFSEGGSEEYTRILASHRPSGPAREADADAGKSYREREIERMISTDPTRYFADEKLQREYQALIARRQGGR